MSAMQANPVLVEVSRGGLVESRHRGAAAVVDAGGSLRAAWGNVDRLVFARSALKPIQALPLLSTGAAERFGLGDEEIALAAASHGGEPVHVERIAAWLARIGLGPEALECGTHPPKETEAQAGLIRSGAAPSALHNNCSGKHAGFLTTARHMGEAPAGYVHSDHPVQQRVAEAIGRLCGIDPGTAPCGIDGCAIPVLGLPLRALALGMARMADPEMLPPALAGAARRIVTAMIRHPYLVAGRERFDTVIMTALAGRAATKVGAEGVHIAILPGHGRGSGLGIAVKIDDGAGRAAEAVMATLIRRFAGDHAALAAYAEAPVLTVGNAEAGSLRTRLD